MASNTKKNGGGYTPSPSVSHFNEDIRNNEIMKVFNNMKDKQRMEVTSLFDLNTIPSVIPKMKK